MCSIENFVCACVRACVRLYCTVHIPHIVCIHNPIQHSKIFVHMPHIHDPIQRSKHFLRGILQSLEPGARERETISVITLQRKAEVTFQWFRAYRSPTSYTRGGLELAIVCMPVYRPSTSKQHCNEQGLTHAHPTMLCIHLVRL